MSRLFFASWKDVIKYSARVRANMVGAEGEENFVPDTSHCRKVLLSNILQQEYEGKGRDVTKKLLESWNAAPFKGSGKKFMALLRLRTLD